MTWRPDPDQSSAWSAAGGATTVVGGGAATALALAPGTTHIPTWLVFLCGLIGLLGFYVMLAPLVPTWPWSMTRAGKSPLVLLVIAAALIAMAVKLSLPISRHGGPTVANASKTHRDNGHIRPSDSSPAHESMHPYNGPRFTAEIPIGWMIHESEQEKPGEIESTWHNPANKNDLILIDLRSASDFTPQGYAEPVHERLLSTPSYQESYYGPGNLRKRDSWMWVFRVDQRQSIDYFFASCSTALAVLGSTTVARFETLRPIFRSVAESVKLRCH